MSNSLRDQLLGLGFKSAPKPERKPERNTAAKPSQRDDKGRGHHQGRPQSSGKPVHKHGAQKPASGRPKSAQEMDLAKAYAMRAQREKDERIAAEAAKQEEARKRREAKAKLAELVKDKALNVADADIARHFPYGGKIKRIYVTAEQLKALNAGDLGVIQLDGRYVLLSDELMAQAAEIFPAAIALRVDPNAPAEEDPYSDPQYQVPDDLVW